jgi:H+-transporting ATPase
MLRPPYKRRTLPETNNGDEQAHNAGNGAVANASYSLSHQTTAINGVDPPQKITEDSLEAHGTGFTYSHGLSTMEASELLVKFGRNELPEKSTSLLYIFLSLLCEPMPCMIWIAIVIEAILGKWMDMGILLGIQMTNASIAFYETAKSGSAVAALKASLRPEATVRRDDKWIHIDATYLVPGDLVLLSTGAAVPADCRINDGTVDIDQSALTGESLPVSMHKNGKCMMGSTVARGEVEATVEATGSNTFFGKTASMLQVTVLLNVMTVLPINDLAYLI